jgi:hypothetical protein
MILVKVEEYCNECLDFNADVIPPSRSHSEEGECTVGDTIIKCKYRKRCAAIRRFLEREIKGANIKNE